MKKIFSKLTYISAMVALLAGLGLMSASAFADQLPGQIEGGNSNYQISNVTQVSGFANTQSAGVCDVLQYRLHLYNPGPGSINDVKVEANINTITPYTTYNSVATAYTPDGLTPQTSFEATLNLSSAQTQSYIKDSTVLLNSAGNVISSSANGTLADTITDSGGGIDIGSLGESIDEYLQFQTKVYCPVIPPAPVPATCNLLSTPAVNGDNVTINSVNYTANSALVSGTSINYGNGTISIYKSTDFPVTYTYPKPGNYTITATVLTNLGNVTSNNCSAAITIAAPTPPPVTPPVTPTTPTTPTSLVNTGPGNIFAVAGIATVLGTIGHYFYRARKLGRSLF